MSRVLLLGEVNPLSEAPEHALYNWPEGCSGWRLQRIFGLRDESYLALGRGNLCRGSWDGREARRRAEVYVLDEPSRDWEVIVMLGRKVARAFGYRDDLFTYREHWPGERLHRPLTLLSLPHPSGRCRLWSLDHNRVLARILLVGLAPEVPWGEALDSARGPLLTSR